MEESIILLGWVAGWAVFFQYLVFRVLAFPVLGDPSSGKIDGFGLTACSYHTGTGIVLAHPNESHKPICFF